MTLDGQLPGGAYSPVQLSIEKHVLINAGCAPHEQNALDQEIFYAANQTATTWSVALNTTHTGLVVSNPLTSNKNLVILKASFAFSAAPAAISHIGLFGGYSGTGIIVHTTPLTPTCTFIGRPGGYGLADAAATLVGTPTWLMPIMGGFTAATLPATSPSVIDIDGAIIVPPGAYVGIGALTASVGFAGIWWKEINI